MLDLIPPLFDPNRILIHTRAVWTTMADGTLTYGPSTRSCWPRLPQSSRVQEICGFGPTSRYIEKARSGPAWGDGDRSNLQPDWTPGAAMGTERRLWRRPPPSMSKECRA